MNAPIAFQGEVMLAGWSETHNGGAKVTFWLADEGDLAAFKSMTVAKGKTAGQRLVIVAVEIGDDEQPVASHGRGTRGFVSQDEVIPAGKPKGGELARLAGVFCQQPEFWEFAGSAHNAQEAAEWIRTVCNVESRADLDHNEAAAANFHHLVRKPYLESRK